MSDRRPEAVAAVADAVAGAEDRDEADLPPRNAVASDRTADRVPLDPGWRERAEAVPRRRVLCQWYARECEKNGRDAAACDPRDRPESELLEPIIDAAGDGARPICTDRARWYRVRLTAPEFECLRVIECPEGRCWNRVAPDDRLLTAARVLRRTDAGVPRRLIDRQYILELADRNIDMESATRRDPVVLFSRCDDPPPRLIDGNHRATATALGLLESGRYDGLHAYLGVEYPVTADTRSPASHAPRDP